MSKKKLTLEEWRKRTAFAPIEHFFNFRLNLIDRDVLTVFFREHWDDVDQASKRLALLNLDIPDVVKEHWDEFDVDMKFSCLRYQNISDLVREKWGTLECQQKFLCYKTQKIVDIAITEWVEKRMTADTKDRICQYQDPRSLLIGLSKMMTYEQREDVLERLVHDLTIAHKLEKMSFVVAEKEKCFSVAVVVSVQYEKSDSFKGTDSVGWSKPFIDLLKASIREWVDNDWPEADKNICLNIYDLANLGDKEMSELYPYLLKRGIVWINFDILNEVDRDVCSLNEDMK